MKNINLTERGKNVVASAAVLTMLGGLGVAAYKSGEDVNPDERLMQEGIGQRYSDNPQNIPEGVAIYTAQPGDNPDKIADMFDAFDESVVSDYVSAQQGEKLDTGEHIALPLDQLGTYGTEQFVSEPGGIPTPILNPPINTLND